MHPSVTYDAIYTARGPRHWNRHPMSISSLMAKGYVIPVWSPAPTLLDAEPTEEENAQVAFLRLVMESE